MHFGSAAGGLVIGVFFSGLGLALATDLRGFASWHSRRAVRSGSRLNGVWPWSRLAIAQRTEDEKAVTALALDRIVGSIFAVVGLIILISGIRVLFGWGS